MPAPRPGRPAGAAAAPPVTRPRRPPLAPARAPPLGCPGARRAGPQAATGLAPPGGQERPYPAPLHLPKSLTKPWTRNYAARASGDPVLGPLTAAEAAASAPARRPAGPAATRLRASSPRPAAAALLPSRRPAGPGRAGPTRYAVLPGSRRAWEGCRPTETGRWQRPKSPPFLNSAPPHGPVWAASGWSPRE